MARKDFNQKIEIYHNRKYRERRVRFYSLLVVVITLLVTLIGIMYIKGLPIDVERAVNKESVHQVMVDEYGIGYVSKFKEVSELRYNRQYEEIRGDYIKEVRDGGKSKELDKKGLELASFVEYVSRKANRKAESFGYQEYSRNYYRDYLRIIEERGSEKDLFNKLVEQHHAEDLDKEVVGSAIEAYDEIFNKSYSYLTSISISEKGD